MTIKTRIYSIVALMATVMVLLGGVSLYFASAFSDHVRDMELASNRAFNGEHLNRLVTAVVMDSRGIYSAADTETAKPFADGITANLEKIDAHLKEWSQIVPAEQADMFQKMVVRSQEFRKFRAETARLGLIDPAQANAQGNTDENRANRKAYQGEIDAVVDSDQAYYAKVKAELDAFRSLQLPLLAGLTMIGVLGAALFATYIAKRHIDTPIARVTDVMRRLADDDFAVDVPYVGEKNEVGSMAAAVQVFKENGIKVAQMNEDERTRMAKAAERARTMEAFQGAFDNVVNATLNGDLSQRIDVQFTDADISRLSGNFNRLMDTVSSGLNEAGKVLAALAEADLTQRMEGDYKGEFAKLRDDTNTVASKLSEIVGQLKKTSFDLKTATSEILSGANDLSERTTKQAATIEETSAAMEQLARTVLNTSERAADASQNAEAVTVAAEEGGTVMVQANEAMERITQSSGKISNIIGMIDDIAFQTNLLALNASVEAARAGEAGKGFAVVAVEVRRLAQSAAEASSEVKALIEQSATEVNSGSKLVAHAANKLETMLDAVRRNRELLDAIAKESREQSASIDEVVTAVRQMDEMTQHNAALVEETNAAIEQTESQASELDTIVAVFTVSGGNTAPEAMRKPVKQATRPATAKAVPEAQPRGIKALQQKVKSAAKTYLSQGNAAVKSDDWAEF